MTDNTYNGVDVNIYRDILLNQNLFNADYCKSKNLLAIVESISTTEIIVPGVDFSYKRELAKINYREYGYRTKRDVIIETEGDIFEKHTTIILKPKQVYALQDLMDLPKAYDDHTLCYQSVLGDVFERIKIKSENIIRVTDNPKHIELYANKNIQFALRIYYDARIMLEKAQESDNRVLMFNLLNFNIYLIYTILYLQNMFSAFYKGVRYNKSSLKNMLYDTIGFNHMYAPSTRIMPTKDKPELDLRIKWNGQINTLITLYYDMMHTQLNNDRMLMECSNDDVKALLSNCFIDRHGKALNSLTIDTCLKDYRDDKRAKGKKRIKFFSA